MGISCDSPFVQKKWQAELDLGFALLSDPNREASRAYNVLLDQLEGVNDVPDRAVFVIGSDGIVRYSWMGAIKGVPKPDDALRAIDEAYPRQASAMLQARHDDQHD